MRSIQSASEIPCFDFEPRLPEPADHRLADSPDMQHVAGLQWPHLLEDRARRQCVAEAEEIVDAVFIKIEAMIRKLAQRRDLRRESQAAVLLGEEQRLDADRVARERQALGMLVPDRDRIHALEREPGIVAPTQISREDRLGIAMVRLELIAALQFAPERGMIDDLAVEHDRVAAVGAEDRLVPALDVDDAEPAHAEAEITVGEIAGVIGTAMEQPVALAGNRLLGTGLPAAPVPAGNAAHGSSSLAACVEAAVARLHDRRSIWERDDQRRNAVRAAAAYLGPSGSPPGRQ